MINSLVLKAHFTWINTTTAQCINVKYFSPERLVTTMVSRLHATEISETDLLQSLWKWIEVSSLHLLSYLFHVYVVLILIIVLKALKNVTFKNKIQPGRTYRTVEFCEHVQMKKKKVHLKIFIRQGIKEKKNVHLGQSYFIM